MSLDRYITERYVDEVCRDTGVTRAQAVAAMRRALDLPTEQPQPVRPHNPLGVAIVLAIAGLGWTVVTIVVALMIAGVLG